MKKFKISPLTFSESKTKNKTRAKILQTTYQLIAKRGLFSFTIADLAEHCGITRRSLYNYYQSAHEIFHELQTLVLKQLTENLDSLDPPKSSAKGQPEAFFTYLMELYHLLKSDRQMLHYLILSDQYYRRNSSMTEDLLLMCFLENRLIKAGLINSSSTLLAESMINYLECFSIKDQVLLKESGLNPQPFELYLASLLKGIGAMNDKKEALV